MTLEELKERIHDYMESEWLNREPSPDCFDYSGSRMAALWDFIEKDQDTANVRAHLINCCRCRYIYANTRATLLPEPPS